MRTELKPSTQVIPFPWIDHAYIAISDGGGKEYPVINTTLFRWDDIWWCEWDYVFWQFIIVRSCGREYDGKSYVNMSEIGKRHRFYDYIYCGEKNQYPSPADQQAVRDHFLTWDYTQLFMILEKIAKRNR